MSVVMDERDLLGFVRGLCLLWIVRRADGPVTPEQIRRLFEERLSEELALLAKGLRSYCDVEEGDVIAVGEEILDATPESLAVPHLNLQLGLLSRRPLPEYPFVTEAGVDALGLTRPFLDTARNLVHAAVRLRMQRPAGDRPDEFSPRVTRFLRGVWGDNAAAEALASASVVNAVSDLLFHNADLETRTADRELLERAHRVMEELRGSPLATVLTAR
jgi:hypothetical protein